MTSPRGFIVGALLGRAMRMASSRTFALVALLLTLGAPSFVSLLSVARASVAEPVTVSGWFATRWLDDFSAEPPAPQYLVQDESGHETVVIVSDKVLAAAGDMRILAGDHVTVTGELLSNGALQAESIWRDYALIEGGAPPVVSGPQPYVTILCRFADSPTYEPHPPSFYAPLIGNTYPYLDHYWQELSFGSVNLVGSSSTATWVTLSRPRSYYIIDETNIRADDLTQDCAAAADAYVFFPSYAGVNMFFNQSLGAYSVGGTTTLTRDGSTRQYGYSLINPLHSPLSTVAHEMGHAFGFPHSSGPYGNTYDSQWDVMSSPGGRCAMRDVSFDCVPPHTIGFHKDLAGWIPASRKIVVQPGTSTTLTIGENSGRDPSSYLLAVVPISADGRRFYTIETRRRYSYDDNVPGEAVLIHSVDTAKMSQGDLNTPAAKVVDPDGNGNPNDAGAAWTEGETYHDSVNGITISVVSSASTSATVTIGKTGPRMWIDGPAAGSTVTVPFNLGGWAIDQGSPSGTGIDQIHVYATPTGGVAQPVGAATYGLSRPDVGTVFGSRFTNSGYSLSVDSLASGTYMFTVFGRSTETATFSAARTAGPVTVVGPQPNPAMSLDGPADNSTVGRNVMVAGWAIDRGAPSGTGVDTIHVWAYPTDGSAAQFVGVATYGLVRADIGGAFGSRFTNSGFRLTTTMNPGTYNIIAFGRSTVTNTFILAVGASNVTVQATNSNAILFVDTPAQNTTATRPFTVSGWAADQGSTSGTGIDAIHIWAFPTSGAAATFVGVGTYGTSRPDIGTLLGDSRFNNSGFTFSVTSANLAAGTYNLIVFGRSTVTSAFTVARLVRVTVQ